MVANEEIPEDLGEMSWSEIQSVVAKVKHELGGSGDVAGHQLLRERLVEAQEALAEIESRWDEEHDESLRDGPDEEDSTSAADEAGQDTGDSIDELLAELLVDEADVEATLPDPEVLEAATTTARGKSSSRVVAAAAPLAADRQPTRPRTLEGPDRPVGGGVPRRRFTTALWVVGAFVLAAVAGTVGVLLLTTSETPEVAETSQGGQLENSGNSASDLEELREVLTILDAGGLDVGWEGSVLRISGTVASTEQLQVVRQTAAAMVDYEELDTAGVIVDEPLVLASESASAPQGGRPVPKLQQDLDRMLRTTPIMFEPGQQELGELDRRILNAAVALILSAPEAEIVIIGHPDEAGTGSGDSDLVAGRVAAVRDYLVERGINPEVLTSAEQATLNSDDAPSVIELIVITDRPNS